MPKHRSPAASPTGRLTRVWEAHSAAAISLAWHPRPVREVDRSELRSWATPALGVLVDLRAWAAPASAGWVGCLPQPGVGLHAIRSNPAQGRASLIPEIVMVCLMV